MNPSCLVSMVQAAAGGVMVWGIFSCHTLGLLTPAEHHLNATAYLSIVAKHVHPFMATDTHLLMATSSKTTHHAIKHVISSSFHERDNEFRVLQRPVTRSRSSTTPLGSGGRGNSQHECECANLQQLRDAIHSTWTRKSRECFQHLIEPMPRRIQPVLGILPRTRKVYLIRWPLSVTNMPPSWCSTVLCNLYT